LVEKVLLQDPEKMTNTKMFIKKAEFHADFKSGEKGEKSVQKNL
jgi:hypothetical protein